ncbi:MAG: inorganic phosphate transporter [Candidatus Gracilibacteria bacterium]
MIFGMSIGVFAFVIGCLTLVSAFEFINGFHDTANAVAPVIYTKSLKARKAVLIAAIMNFLGVMLGGVGVAMAIIHLLPLDAIGYQSTTFGIVVIVSLLLSAIIWNFATWFFGIPASSSHSLIGAILGVTMILTITPMKGYIKVIPNWEKAIEVIESLLISPIIGFFLAFIIMSLSYKYIKNKYYFSTPSKKKKRVPKLWLRSLLIGTSAWVSFAHGSNDGQKGVGLAVLILVVLVPSLFAINPKVNLNGLKGDISYIENSVNNIDVSKLDTTSKKVIKETITNLSEIKVSIDAGNINKMELREDILTFQKNIKNLSNINLSDNDSMKTYQASIIGSKDTKNENGISLLNDAKFNDSVTSLSKLVDYAPWWIIALISISLGLGTMVGRKRIVKTIGEKIGKTDMNYAQATTSAMITAITISFASLLHLPVSTTHILSSSVAGTMSSGPDAGGVQGDTVKNIVMAWVFTLPITILLSFDIFFVLWYLFVK